MCSSGKNVTYQNNDTNPVYPGEYKLSNVISASSSNSSDRRATNAHIGATTVDIFAPGENIISTYPNSRYVYMSGSSMAAPHVAGVAALVLSRTPGLNGAQLKTRIMNNVDNVTNSGGGSVFGSLCVSGGRLNAYKAITNAAGYTTS